MHKYRISYTFYKNADDMDGDGRECFITTDAPLIDIVLQEGESCYIQSIQEVKIGACTRPPEGWYCIRGEHDSGPCAALPKPPER